MDNRGSNVEDTPPLIQIRDLCKTFGTGQKHVEALRGLSFDIYEQEFISIVGASGAGKSTLLHILGTLDRPSGGHIYYRGEDIFSWNDKKMAQFRNHRIGFVFQMHHLLPEFTALENTMMPALIRGMKKRIAAVNAEAILVKLGLENRIHHKPGELSGGEQQRVAIARALILKPEIILADEPTGNLDSETGNEVFDLLISLNREEKIVMAVVTHNERLSAKIPRCIILQDGKQTGERVVR
ncbi:MAG: ABC transporter ATP-binding protein [Pseudomonadota bacterium]